VPFASSWKPGAVAWGVLALWCLLAVEVTSLAGRRVPKAWWRRIHLTSYLVLLASTLHLVTAGTDARHPGLVVAVVAVLAAPAFFEVYRRVGPGRAASVRSSSAAG
jgi:DMSO/TMAO reductase YedYZ heme-binding membrane subunit